MDWPMLYSFSSWNSRSLQLWSQATMRSACSTIFSTRTDGMRTTCWNVRWKTTPNLWRCFSRRRYSRSSMWWAFRETEEGEGSRYCVETRRHLKWTFRMNYDCLWLLFFCKGAVRLSWVEYQRCQYNDFFCNNIYVMNCCLVCIAPKNRKLMDDIECLWDNHYAYTHTACKKCCCTRCYK